MANPLTNNLTPERALIFHITHISNIPWFWAMVYHAKVRGLSILTLVFSTLSL